MTQTKKTVYVVRKHIIDGKSGEKIRFEDYPKQFSSPEEAQSFVLEKTRKYLDSVEAAIEDGCPPEEVEGRAFRIVPIQVSV